MRCQDCETVTDLVFETTRFWFHVPTGDSFAKLASLCGRQALIANQVSDRCIEVSMSSSAVDGFLTAMFGAMTSQELQHTLVVTTPGHEPGAKDMGRMVPAGVLINRVKGQWVIESINRNSFESWFQPIVHANDPARMYGAEALFRLRGDDGALIPPGHVFQIAEDANILFAVDLVARANAVKTAAAHGFSEKIFINFNPSSVYDPAYCLRTTAAAIDELGLKPSDIVFEITETEQIRDVDHLKGILTFYRRAGFLVALDDIGSGWSGLNILHSFSPDIIKLDMDLVRDVDQDEFRASIVTHLTDMAHENGIKVVAEGIETPEEARTVQRIGVDYLQGFYFARPGPLGEVMAAWRAQAALAPAPANRTLAG